MNRRSGGALVLCMAVSTLVPCYRADAGNQSDWFRWSPGGGVVQHVVTNDSAVLRRLTISSMFSGNCNSNGLPRFGRNDRRFSFGTAYVELKPHTWIALFSPIAEREVNCNVDLLLAKPAGEAEKL